MSSTYYHMGDEFARTRARRWQAQCARLILALHCLDRALLGASDGGGVVKKSMVENGVCIFKCLMEHATFTGKLMRHEATGIVRNIDLKIVDYINDMIVFEKNDTIFYFRKSTIDGVKNIDVLLKRFAKDEIELTSQKISKKLEAIGFKKTKTNIGNKMSIPLEEYKKIAAIAVKPQPEMEENHVTKNIDIKMLEKDLDTAVEIASEKARRERELVEERLAVVGARYKKGA